MHWRETMRPTRFFTLDGRLSILLLLFGLWPTYWMLAILSVAIVALVLLERRGLSVDGAYRMLRRGLASVLVFANPLYWVTASNSRYRRPMGHRPATVLTRQRSWIDRHPAEVREMTRRLTQGGQKTNDKGKRARAAVSVEADDAAGAPERRRSRRRI